MHHGCEAGPTELRPVCLPREARTADQKVPPDGGDGLPGPWHEGEWDLLHFMGESLNRKSWEWNLCCNRHIVVLKFRYCLIRGATEQETWVNVWTELFIQVRVCWMNSSMISKGFNWGSFVVLSTRVDSSLGNVCLAPIVKDWPLHACIRWQH